MAAAVPSKSPTTEDVLEPMDDANLIASPCCTSTPKESAWGRRHRLRCAIPSLLSVPPPGRNLQHHQDAAMVAARDLRALESHLDVIRIKNAAEAREEPAGDRRTHRLLPRRPPVGIFASDNGGLPRA